MNISKSWLEQYVPIHCDVETLCAKLTMAGIEVEAVENAPRVPAGVVVAKIILRAYPESTFLMRKRHPTYSSTEENGPSPRSHTSHRPLFQWITSLPSSIGFHS